MNIRLLLQMSCVIVLAGILVPSFASSDTHAGPGTNVRALERLAEKFHEDLLAKRPPLYYEMLQSQEPAQAALNRNRDIQLMYIDENGRPVYYAIENKNSARTISTFDVWPGKPAGLYLDGSSTVLGELGVWDVAGVLTTHQELTGRVTQMDSPGATHYHSTHVSGTLIASGVVPTAKGMSHAGVLAARDWTNDESEMAAAGAAGMLVSSHSYGTNTGWDYNETAGAWYWYGTLSVSTTEDVDFGFYKVAARDWDQIAYNAPYYTIVISAGNDRGDGEGPGPGGGHYVYNHGWVWSTDTRDPDGGADQYECLPPKKTAKNIITVGAVQDITGGYTQPSDVSITGFSSWGPTDDGRIKPDVVANGKALYSCSDAGPTVYTTLDGTSMAAPSVAGSLNLLVGHYEATHGRNTPLSSTMKAVVIQTANEAGPDRGPDYIHGWGLMSTLKAAQLIQADSLSPGHIREDALANGETDDYYFTSGGNDSIMITMAWTDPAGTPPPLSLNPTTPMLVNDLDLRLERVGGSTYYPYILDPANPADAATTGDNSRDNVEQILLASPTPGTYHVSVSHKGTLTAAQSYSLVASTVLDLDLTVVAERGELTTRHPVVAVVPNPFNPTAEIQFELFESGLVDMAVFDVTGRLVTTLARGHYEAGSFTKTWDGTDAAGHPVGAGVYFAVMKAGDFVTTQKMVLAK